MNRNTCPTFAPRVHRLGRAGTILALAWLTGAGCQSPGTPADAAARLARAGEECQQGNWDGALADLDRVIKLTPDSAPAHQLRGQAKQVRGDFPGTLA